MINYTDPRTGFSLEESDVNECLCKLVIFCNLNPGLPLAQELGQKLTEMEDAVNNQLIFN